MRAVRTLADGFANCDANARDARHCLSPDVGRTMQPLCAAAQHFFCASFFPFFALPFPRQFSSPKSGPSSGTSGPFLAPQVYSVLLVEKRQPARAGFWGRFWTGSPHRKKSQNTFSRANFSKVGPRKSHEKCPNTVFPSRCCFATKRRVKTSLVGKRLLKKADSLCLV